MRKFLTPLLSILLLAAGGAGWYFYDKEQKLFTTYDGLVFRQNEIISWCNDRYLDYMIKYVEYPTDKLYERNG